MILLKKKRKKSIMVIIDVREGCHDIIRYIWIHYELVTSYKDVAGVNSRSEGEYNNIIYIWDKLIIKLIVKYVKVQYLKLKQ